jgi:catechol 2,3-dioxygenase-like lactoylglutathione lyase family enzyme
MSIHHITAIAGDPQRNLDFYTGILGLRLVKLTVNFDDPGTYHLYFGDETGRPGSLLTFFPWPDGLPGRQGTGQVGEVSLAIPQGSLGAWIERLLTRGVKFEGPTPRFEERVLSFRDPDGLLLELVATGRVSGVEPWREGPVPAEHAIRGVHGVTIWEDGDRGAESFLTDTMGFRRLGQEGQRLRLQSAARGAGSVVDLRRTPGFWQGAEGVGTVHHVAFRAASDQEQLLKRTDVLSAGLDPTPVVDREYFRSVYFREPSGVLFEIATDGPGFAVDEPPSDLGTSLQLPPKFRPMRDRILASLPPLRLPHVTAPEI